MKKIILLVLVSALLLLSCEPQAEPKESQRKEAFCGDYICQDNEKENDCRADCGGFEGITKRQCVEAGGNWNECGSPCAGTNAEFCILVCQEQCECGGIAGFKCPAGYKCRLSGKTADEMGVCVKE